VFSLARHLWPHRSETIWPGAVHDLHAAMATPATLAPPAIDHCRWLFQVALAPQQGLRGP
jgi:hypothetical protein